MPAVAITDRQSLASDRPRSANSAGVDPPLRIPSCSYFAFTAGSLSTSLASWLTFCTSEEGLFAGMYSAYQEVTSRSGTPDSAIVGSSVAVANRFFDVTARPRTWPALIAVSSVPAVLNMQSTRAAIKSVNAGPPPRYGTWRISIPARRANSTPVR